jgi:2-phospho-L-lactate transferase/gluconeogenesis factor (CofD/UPF0052 family)
MKTVSDKTIADAIRCLRMLAAAADTSHSSTRLADAVRMARLTARKLATAANATAANSRRNHRTSIHIDSPSIFVEFSRFIPTPLDPININMATSNDISEKINRLHDEIRTIKTKPEQTVCTEYNVDSPDEAITAIIEELDCLQKKLELAIEREEREECEERETFRHRLCDRHLYGATSL